MAFRTRQECTSGEGMMQRDVGEMGEQLLGQWAAEAGVTANNAHRDRS